MAILEVALRNAMSARLEAKWGLDWYSNPDLPLDDHSTGALNRAWKEIKDPKSPGKVVAQCMFGFWRNLLDRGDYFGREPRRVRCGYEVLWRGVLSKAFPGGGVQAQNDRERWNREYALSIVSRVRALRNRVAHHEPMVNGFPLPGQRKRVSATEAYEDLKKLASMLDRDLSDFLSGWAHVPALLESKPKIESASEED